MTDGFLVAVEGLDGAGKSMVVDHLGETFEEVITTGEPTPFETGDWCRRAIETDKPATTDFFTFCADRANHVDWIEDRIDDGYVVVSDRYADSTRAYQAHRFAEEWHMEEHYVEAWMEGVFDPWNREADLTIYIDIPVQVAIERSEGTDKFEGRENLEKVKENYDRMYDNCDPGCRIIDGTLSPLTVKKQAANAIRSKLHSEEPDPGHDTTYAEAVDE